MDLKELLGEELFNQVKEKAGDHQILVFPKDAKVIEDDGKLIPKHRLDEAIEQKKNAEKQLKTVDDELKKLKETAGDNEGLKTKIDELTQANEQIKKDGDKRAADLEFQYALRDVLKSKYQAINPAEVMVHLNLENITKDGPNFIGLDEQMKPVKDANKHLFGKKIVSGEPPEDGVDDDDDADVQKYKGKNPFTDEHWNMTEQGRLYNSDPKLYNKLKKLAGPRKKKRA